MKFSRQGAHRLREKMKVGANTSVPVSRDGTALKKVSKGTLVSGDVLSLLLSPPAKSGKLPTSLPCRDAGRQPVCARLEHGVGDRRHPPRLVFGDGDNRDPPFLDLVVFDGKETPATTA